MNVTLAFTEAAVSEIAALLGVAVRAEPYRVGGDAVYRLEVANATLGASLTVLLWPSLGRADVRLGDCSMVYRGIATVELLPGVEVIFRREDGAGYLFVSVSGRASVVV